MTRIYGASDDLVEFEGDFTGEVECYGTDEKDTGVLIFVSDGTVLEVKYGKGGMALWETKLLKRGGLFLNIEPCDDEDAKIHSDIAIFSDGITGAWAATEWERVS